MDGMLLKEIGAQHLYTSEEVGLTCPSKDLASVQIHDTEAGREEADWKSTPAGLSEGKKTPAASEGLSP